MLEAGKEQFAPRGIRLNALCFIGRRQRQLRRGNLRIPSDSELNVRRRYTDNRGGFHVCASLPRTGPRDVSLLLIEQS